MTNKPESCAILPQCDCQLHRPGRAVRGRAVCCGRRLRARSQPGRWRRMLGSVDAASSLASSAGVAPHPFSRARREIRSVCGMAVTDQSRQGRSDTELCRAAALGTLSRCDSRCYRYSELCRVGQEGWVIKVLASAGQHRCRLSKAGRTSRAAAGPPRVRCKPNFAAMLRAILHRHGG